MLLTREQLQDRLIALHQASMELVKDDSLESLLERIASIACEQAEARYAALGVLDENGILKQFITTGISADQIKRISSPPKGRGLIGALMNIEEPIRIPEIANDPRSIGFPMGHPEMHSFLGVPIRQGDRQLGQIYLTDKIGQPEFNSDDEKIIQMLAAYAAIAIQNARLYKGLRERDNTLTRRTEDLALLNNVASALTGSLDPNEILNKTLTLVMDYIKVEAGEIFLLDEDDQTLRLVLHHGQATEAFWTRNRFAIGEGIVGLTAQRRTPIISTDLAHDKNFLRDAVVQTGFYQMVCLPLITNEHLIGVLSIATRNRKPFDERCIHLLAAVGNWTALGIENAHLHNNARRLAVLEERERIGMDLHDGIIQSIFGIGLSLENIRHSLEENPQHAKQRIQRVIDDLNQSIRDIRAYILDLRPRQLNGEGVMEGLKRLVTEFGANTPVEAILTSPKEDISDLTQNCALALFHICQEAIANVAKHAGAKYVNVDVWATPERVLMEIRDDGKGFNVDKMNVALGHGLANMQTRIHSVGGEIDITSITGEGTTVLAWVPRMLIP